MKTQMHNPLIFMRHQCLRWATGWRWLLALLLLMPNGAAGAAPWRAPATTSAAMPPTIVQMAAGYKHLCVLTNTGDVACRGYNHFGQLGDGSTTSQASFVAVAGLTDTVAIAAGYWHTCALTNVGAVKCWGLNNRGQLGNGTTIDAHTPVTVTGLNTGVITITAGYAHTCAVLGNGGVQCWGWNAAGQLGDGTSTDAWQPVNVSGTLTNTTAIAAGDMHTCAITNGGLKCWGWNYYGQLGINNLNIPKSLSPTVVAGMGSGVSAIALGGRHSCALTTLGAVKCWGENGNGRLGDGTTTQRFAPVNVINGVQAIALGGFSHTCALMTAGGVKCWGRNDAGQLGNGTTNPQLTPVDVIGIPNNLDAIAAGGLYTCALSAGAVQCWGHSPDETESILPGTVVGLSSGVAAIGAGQDHTCALTTAGGVKCWGWGWQGQLGTGTFADAATPTNVINLTSGVSAIAVGARHTCALTTTGGVKCWGWNNAGQLGNGTTLSSAVPIDVAGLTNTVAIAAGYWHTCALTNVGNVKCWGENGYGQLGNGTITNQLTPTLVSSLSGVSQLIGGGRHTCALLNTGTLKCWGDNHAGQVGDGTIISRTTPVTVSVLTNTISLVTAGQYHTCAVLTTSTMQCWGYNSFGQLGNGLTATIQVSAVTVLNLTSPLTAITAGLAHTCALNSNSAVKCWGYNMDAELGDNTLTQRLTAVDVLGLGNAGISTIAAGLYHTCALTTQGAVKCWGIDTTGQLGRGTSLLNIYAYAADNAPLATVNLDTYFYEFMRRLQTATQADPNKTSIVLVDHNTLPDAVYKVENGIVTNITAQWPAMPTEVTVTAGTVVGGFAQWARATFPAARTTFSYVGHGLFVAPETDWSQLPVNLTAPTNPTNLFPLPWTIGGGPNFTDQNPRDMLSIYDLSEMLRLASNDGANPLDVVDLMLCFQLSLENAYALRDYATTLVGTPNYAFFAPTMMGTGLMALNGWQTPQQMATALVTAYDTALPASDHPRVLTALDTAGLDMVKENMDELADALMTGLSGNDPDPVLDRAYYRTALRNAYQAAVHYDTNCDFDCAVPDALVDAADFLRHLSLQSPWLVDVNMTAQTAADNLANLVLTHTVHSGSPWLKSSANWNFANATGISLFADLEGQVGNGVTHLNGIGHWYTSTASLLNPEPYEFVTIKMSGYAWDDVLSSYWAGTAITTTLCIPDFPPALETGEIIANGLPLPLAHWPVANHPVWFEMQYAITDTIHNPLGMITVTNSAGAAVFTDTFPLGFHFAGGYRVRPTLAWTPTISGVYTATYWLDSRQQVQETNEFNNTFTQKVVVASPSSLPAIVAQTPAQWVYTPTFPVTITDTAGQLSEVLVQYWRYTAGVDPNTQVPNLMATQQLNTPNLPGTFNLTLPGAQAGLYEIYLWPYQSQSPAGYGEPVKFTINYLQPNATLAVGAEDFFRFTTNLSDVVELNLATTSAVELYVWSPSNPWSAQQLIGPGIFPLNLTEAGEYVVSVHNPGNVTATYTLTATHNGGPLGPEQVNNGDIQWVARLRPEFVEPLLEVPTLLKLMFLPLVVR